LEQHGKNKEIFWPYCGVDGLKSISPPKKKKINCVRFYHETDGGSYSLRYSARVNFALANQKRDIQEGERNRIQRYVGLTFSTTIYV
jgi:hypothetical protein